MEAKSLHGPQGKANTSFASGPVHGTIPLGLVRKASGVAKKAEAQVARQASDAVGIVVFNVEELDEGPLDVLSWEAKFDTLATELRRSARLWPHVESGALIWNFNIEKARTFNFL